MKKVILLFTTLILLLLTAGANAQTTPAADFFTGSWKLTAGSPVGDTELTISLTRKDGKLEGAIKVADQDEVKFSKIEEKEASLVLNFTSNHGYDVKLVMVKKDDNHVTGSLDTGSMGSFDAKGERIKANN